MRIDKILLYMFPDANSLIDYVIQDDGDGQYIKEWNLLDPQPTQQELESNESSAEIYHLKMEAKKELELWDSQGDTARMAEDCMSILIGKGIITSSDFSSQSEYDAVVARINRRKTKRLEAI